MRHCNYESELKEYNPKYRLEKSISDGILSSPKRSREILKSESTNANKATIGVIH